MVKITLFFTIYLDFNHKMTKQGRITRSTNIRATAERLRDELFFLEAMAQVHNEAVLAVIRSYILGMFADDE